MKFSICIPNYNYEKYLGETLESVLQSTYADFEILISDNASPDGSVSLIRKFQMTNRNILLRVNQTNVGFSANLDLAGAMASGERMIMLSSDDRMMKNALEVYATVAQENPQAIISAAMDIIDSEGKIIGYSGPDKRLWTKDDIDYHLSELLKCTVYRIKSEQLLIRSLKTMATPFNFCTVSYHEQGYKGTGGYGGGRLINPDKWFHWKLLSVTKEAIFIDKPLFQYRWHDQNQTALQKQSGYLKYLSDEYRNTIEMPDPVLVALGITRRDFHKSFMRNDIYKHGVGEFIKGRWLKSVRVFFFGLSTFPEIMITRPLFIPYLILLLSTPVVSVLAGAGYRLLKSEK